MIIYTHIPADTSVSLQSPKGDKVTASVYVFTETFAVCRLFVFADIVVPF